MVRHGAASHAPERLVIGAGRSGFGNSVARALHGAGLQLRSDSFTLELRHRGFGVPPRNASHSAQTVRTAAGLLRKCGSHLQRLIPTGFEAKELTQLMQAFDGRQEGALNRVAVQLHPRV